MIQSRLTVASEIRSASPAVAPLDEQLSQGAGGAIDSSIESQGSKPAAGQVAFHKHAQKNSGRLSRFAASFRLPE